MHNFIIGKSSRDSRLLLRGFALLCSVKKPWLKCHQLSTLADFSKAGLPLQLAVQLPSGQRFAGCVFFSKETLLCSQSAGAWDWFGGRPVCVCARRGFILPAAGGWRRMRAITRDFRNQRRSRPAERAAEQPLQSVGSGGAEQCRVSRAGREQLAVM